MSQDQSAVIENTPSHDDNADSSTAPVVEANAGEESSAVETSATETPEEVKKPNKVQERINQLTREKHEERQKNAELEDRIKKLESTQAATPKPDLVAPNEDDFDTHAEYLVANTTFVAESASNAAYDRITAENQKSAEASAQQAQQQTIQSKKADFDKNVDSKRSNFEDFEDVAYGHTFMDQDLALQIFDMDKGPEVAYHLGSHLDTAERIFALDPVQRARELTKLEFQVEALKPKVVSDAPDPIKPLGSSEAVEADPDKMSTDEWQKWRNKQLHG